MNILPSNVKLASSSTSPDAPAIKTLSFVKSLIFNVGTTMFPLNVVVIAPVLVSTTNMSFPPSSFKHNASAKFVGTTISFSPVAPLKLILSVRYKSFHALVAVPIS